MSDDELILPTPPPPEPTQPVLHPKEQRRATTALWISCIAALFALAAAIGSIWQASEAHHIPRVVEQPILRPIGDPEVVHLRRLDTGGELYGVRVSAQNIGRTAALDINTTVRLCVRYFVEGRPCEALLPQPFAIGQVVLTQSEVKKFEFLILLDDDQDACVWSTKCTVEGLLTLDFTDVFSRHDQLLWTLEQDWDVAEKLMLKTRSLSAAPLLVTFIRPGRATDVRNEWLNSTRVPKSVPKEDE
jgi:hypothetical protein